MGVMEPDELVAAIAEIAADKKAIDIRVIDLRGIVSYTDFFVICSGNTERQTKAIHDAIYEDLKHADERLLPRRTDYAGLGRSWPRDVAAGVTVGIVALPLSMALAVASGVAPQHGLYTAIVAGAVIALLGGSRVQVSGPTAAFVAILVMVQVGEGLPRSIVLFLFFFFQVNSLLAVFNLIPLPPLDGSRLLTIFLPPKRQNIIFFLDRYGFIILLGLLLFAGATFLDELATPVRNFLARLAGADGPVF